MNPSKVQACNDELLCLHSQCLYRRKESLYKKNFSDPEPLAQRTTYNNVNFGHCQVRLMKL